MFSSNINCVLLLAIILVDICVGNVFVVLNAGVVKGSIKKNLDGGEYYSFQSIPYAKPPLGKLRFKAPEKPDAWKGILDATKSSPICPQYESETIVGNEDCLYLNVYSASLIETAKLPVMVYIHGGFYYLGSGSTDYYGPEFLLTEDIVLVTLNYRIGKLGSLSFQDQSLGVPGNAHLKDQVMALRWIRENINAFGGCKDTVTVFGGGVGGSSAHLHTLSPMSNGLIHAAIAQSGAALNPWSIGVLGTGEMLAKKLGIESSNFSEIIEILQQKPVEEIIGSFRASFPNLMQIWSVDNGPFFASRTGPNEYGIVVETQTNEPAFLPMAPAQMIKSRKENVPIIFGYNNRESLIFQANPRLSQGLFLDNIENSIPLDLRIPSKDIQEVVDKINATFFDNNPAKFEDLDKLIDYISSLWFTNSIHQTIDLCLTHNDVNQTLYLYEFASDTKLNLVKRSHPMMSAYKGASHKDELGHLFNTKNTPFFDLASEEDLAFRAMVKLWTNFAKYKNPFQDASVEWPVLRNDDPWAYALINGINITIQENSTARMHFDFWKKLYHKYNKN